GPGNRLVPSRAPRFGRARLLEGEVAAARPRARAQVEVGDFAGAQQLHAAKPGRRAERMPVAQDLFQASGVRFGSRAGKTEEARKFAAPRGRVARAQIQ